MSFTVYESPEGWFVTGVHPIGPFISKRRAMTLAQQMVSAVRATGEDAVVVVEAARSWRAPAVGLPGAARAGAGAPGAVANSG